MIEKYLGSPIVGRVCKHSCLLIYNLINKKNDIALIKSPHKS